MWQFFATGRGSSTITSPVMSNMSCPRFSSHARRKTHGFLACKWVGDTLARDIVGGSMGRCADREGEAAEHSYSALETHKFHRDLPLVMIHCQDGMVLVLEG